MKRIMVIMGTRPEAIKLCPVVLELKRRADMETFVVSSGQHRELLEAAMKDFSVLPDRRLECMREGQNPAVLLSRLMSEIDAALEELAPDTVIVQGDTSTAFAGALAAFYRGIRVAHVEAGLRTYRMRDPFPEELHRRAISLLSDLHFAPTETSKANLLREGIDPKSILVTGNTVVDALRITLKTQARMDDLKIHTGQRLLIFTAHRREHLEGAIFGMASALRRLVDAIPDAVAICPLHPNPAVRRAVGGVLAGHARIHCIEPPSVVCFHHLLARASLILTDSGGIQEEATALGIPTVVMRDFTEREEGVEAGNLILAGSGEEAILETAFRLLSDPNSLESMKIPSEAFGRGDASVKIVDFLQKN